MPPPVDFPKSWVTDWLDRADHRVFGDQDGDDGPTDHPAAEQTEHGRLRDGVSWVGGLLGARARWVGMVTLGLIPVALTLLVFGLTTDPLPFEFVVVHLLATIPPFLTPSATHYWEAVFERFIDQMEDIVQDTDALHSTAKAWKERFTTWWPVTSLGWMALILLVIGTNVKYFQDIGIGGIGDAAFWVYVLYAGWWGFITGFGFIGAFVMIGTIHEVSTMTFELDPLQPDGLAGLSSVGYFAIRTIWLLSTGSFTFPYAFVLGTQGVVKPLVYVATGIYILLLTVSFLYPTLRVNTRAQDIRDDELTRRRDDIRDLREEIRELEQIEDKTDADRLEAVNKRLEIQRLQEEFDEYAALNLYPFSVGIVIQFVSALLPAIVVVLDAVLTELLLT